MKKYIVIAIFLTTLFSGIAFAAGDDQVAVDNALQPYVVATNAAAHDTQTSNPMIVQDTFVVATQATGQEKIRRELYVASTGYNSEVGQTDASPFTAADGTHVYDGMVAANFLPFGTKIKIPDYFGDKVFTVHDRMNPRYWERVDVWFPEHSAAVQWGVRKVKIVILGS